MGKLRLYDRFRESRRALWISLVTVTVAAAALLLRLDYSEDIGDFLPLGTSDREALSVYQQISGAEDIYILFSNPGDADLTVQAMDFFVETVRQKDTQGWMNDLSASFDMEKIRQVSDFILSNTPYFLKKEDYAVMDSLLANPAYVESQLSRDAGMLMFPTGGFMASNISADPLALFTPALKRLKKADPQMNFEMYDGHIFTPDMTRAIAMTSSPFGNSETKNNARLLDILEDAIDEMEAAYPGVTAHIAGGPQIAVGNASRIKTDSIIAISLSVVLIMLVLIFSFRSFRNILLIFLSIGWGWLFAMGGMSLLSDKVSIIVIGISSVILGIAVNYPLHLIVHTAHQKDLRKAMKEITAPLVTGNITTVGAFLALVPLKSVALRDLGLFASLLLVGTILFVLLYLPHFIKVEAESDGGESRLMSALTSFSPEKYRSIVVAVALLTVVFGIYSSRTGFDTDLTHINYMTQAQRDDMQYFQDLYDGDSEHMTSSLYVLSRGYETDEALTGNSMNEAIADSLVREGLVLSHRGISDFIVSKECQRERLALWCDFVNRHRKELTEDLKTQAELCDFSADAFDRFNALVESADTLSPRGLEYFSPLTGLVFKQNLAYIDEAGMYCAVDILNVEDDRLDEVKACFKDSFDVAGMNAALSNNLSDNFNYIGIACSLIVFFFLWFSFGRIELALLSFLPMAVSWVWILGIMAIFGIKFNIVNIILATFIFGQGDDYTIFMTEGCQWEYAHGRPMLKSYKSGILRSALIMFVGMGTLIVAKHPAMRSLAELTIIGMASVVMMAYLIPPLFFKWLTTKGGAVRRHPLTIASLFGFRRRDAFSQVLGRYIYKGNEIYRTAKSNLKFLKNSADVKVPEKGILECSDHGYGETAIYLALAHPGVEVVAVMDNDEKKVVAEIAAHGFVDNIEFKL